MSHDDIHTVIAAMVVILPLFAVYLYEYITSTSKPPQEKLDNESKEEETKKHKPRRPEEIL
jgi:hypothetical protein